MGGADEARIPKVLVNIKVKTPPFVDATGTLSGSLLGDVRHDHSKAVEWKLLHTRELTWCDSPGGGVLYIDEINLLSWKNSKPLQQCKNAFPILDDPSDLVAH